MPVRVHLGTFDRMSSTTLLRPTTVPHRLTTATTPGSPTGVTLTLTPPPGVRAKAVGSAPGLAEHTGGDNRRPTPSSRRAGSVGMGGAITRGASTHPRGAGRITPRAAPISARTAVGAPSRETWSR